MITPITINIDLRTDGAFERHIELEDVLRQLGSAILDGIEDPLSGSVEFGETLVEWDSPFFEDPIESE